MLSSIVQKSIKIGKSSRSGLNGNPENGGIIFVKVFKNGHGDMRK